MSPYLLHQFLAAAAERDPAQPLVVHEGATASYAEIDAAANRFARALVSAGIQRGDRVGLFSHNSRLYVESYFAILKAGGVAVPINTSADAATLQGFLSDCGARLLIAGPRTEKAVSGAILHLPDLRALFCADPAKIQPLPAHVAGMALAAAVGAEPATAPPERGLDLDLAAIVYTSGSTGRPRGAMLSHLNLCANTRSINAYLNLSAADRGLAILPFYYVYGASVLHTHVAAGATVVIENRFMFPSTALDTLEKEHCTGLAGVPSTFAILLNKSNFAERELASLRYVTQAGGPMAPELTRRLIAALRGRQLFVMYGATEASARLTYLDPRDLTRKLGSIGRPIANVELRILRDDGTEAAAGETGEIVARGSNIMRGYWGDADETARVLSPHGYHTGDLGVRDEDGFFWIVGRKKDMIKAGAHRIAAKEIEDAILEHPEVHETAVIGIPDEILGEAIRAYVVFRDGAPGDAADLEKFLKQRLPPYKVPSSIVVRTELPKNDAGKILKASLRAEADGEAAAEVPGGAMGRTGSRPTARPADSEETSDGSVA